MPGPLVKGLPQELGTGPAEMNPLALAAAPLHRRNATEGLQFAGAVEALPLRAQRRDQSGLQGRASSRQGSHYRQLRVHRRDRRDLPVQGKAAMWVRSTLMRSSSAR